MTEWVEVESRMFQRISSEPIPEWQSRTYIEYLQSRAQRGEGWIATRRKITGNHVIETVVWKVRNAEGSGSLLHIRGGEGGMESG